MNSFCEQYGYHRLTSPSRKNEIFTNIISFLIHDHIVGIKNFQKGFLTLTIWTIRNLTDKLRKKKLFAGIANVHDINQLSVK